MGSVQLHCFSLLVSYLDSAMSFSFANLDKSLSINNQKKKRRKEIEIVTMVKDCVMSALKTINVYLQLYPARSCLQAMSCGIKLVVGGGRGGHLGTDWGIERAFNIINVIFDF